ncbi:MAG: type II toxin-antitoxin system Phd/YefM family antitoxin [Candidatus Dormibacteria bacterium]
MNRVGVRELRQNASKVLDRVKRGESVEVTERGTPVAMIVPLRPVGVLERLVAEGHATAPTGSLCDLPMPRPPRRGTRLPSEILEEMRSDER